MDISIKQKLQELAAKEDSEYITDSMFQVLWSDLNQGEKRYLYDYALKLIEEKRMTFVVSQLLPLGLSLEKCEEIEACIRNSEPVYCCLENVFMDDEIRFKIQELID